MTNKTGRTVQRVIISLDEIASTNSEMKRLQSLSPMSEGAVVMANFQTGGRGQAGNTWHSSKGANLLFSVIIYPHFVAPSKQFIISRIVSIALRRVLSAYIDNVTIKWPNDIYWKDKKIAGILIENSLMGSKIEHSIIGVGLNVNEDSFPKDLINPISLKQIVGEQSDRTQILNEILQEFEILYGDLIKGNLQDIEKEYMQYLFRYNERHSFEDRDGVFEGVIKDVLPSGHLVVETAAEQERKLYAFKEISFII